VMIVKNQMTVIAKIGRKKIEANNNPK